MSGGHRIDVRTAQPSDLDEILELLRSALGPGSVPRTAEFWRWKHEANPFGPSPAWVAVADGRIAGLRTLLRWRWRLEDRTLEAVRAVDTATHPDWQRRGIFWKLTRESLDVLAEEGCEFVFNTPNRKSAAGYRKLGWNPALKPTIWARAVKPLRMAGAAIRGGAHRSTADLSAFPAASELLRRSALDRLLAEYDRSWQARLYTPRDRDYLDWRYVQIPDVDYHTLFERKGDAAMALIFRSRLRRSMREVLVSEILGRGDAAARSKLFASLFERLRTECDCDYVVAGAPPGSEEAGYLREVGFRRLPSGPSLMVRPLPTSTLGGAELTGDCWQLAIGDLEIF